ncbi:ABC transporter ATP-binding protein [Jiangella gansuensis]|uniref:ABC transporter ATP-binding protein n=1 Tax=Jiangella gansuensis TaxID=281473 RepID=UPI00047AA413|nr:oligopeptide/dipeptide ABC transporter ATP-binding protein [Jiangella gansuensis]
MTGADVLRLEGLKVHFPIQSQILRRRQGTVYAVDGVDLSLHQGETLGLVGESGCGKSTLGRTIMRMYDASAGRVLFQGQDVTALAGAQLREYRRKVQLIFQDPYMSLNPRMTVREVVTEPLVVQQIGTPRERAKVVDDALEQVGLLPEHATRYPHEFSGGQRQRIGIARALTLQPEVLVLDEPVSALDVSIQAQVVNLLTDLQERLGIAFLFIAHDLSVVKHISDRVAVMYLGRIVEEGPTEQVFAAPTHPYTQALLSAVPLPDPDGRGRREEIVLEGDVPNPAAPPSGCRFRTRCWKATERCAAEEPLLIEHGDAGRSACHYAEGRDMLQLSAR